VCCVGVQVIAHVCTCCVCIRVVYLFKCECAPLLDRRSTRVHVTGGGCVTPFSTPNLKRRVHPDYDPSSPSVGPPRPALEFSDSSDAEDYQPHKKHAKTQQQEEKEEEEEEEEEEEGDEGEEEGLADEVDETAEGDQREEGDEGEDLL